MIKNSILLCKKTISASNDELPYLELAGIDAVFAAGLRSADADLPHCRNQFENIQYTPNPEPEYSDEPITPNGAFDRVADMVDDAQYEVLFVTMQYEPNDTPPSPGSILANGVGALYQKVKANPDAYPRGMTVRVMLGNYPEMSYWAWGTQIIAAITDFRDAGVEKMVDPEIGWRLEVANFPGTYPHSHTKFVVVDGKTVTSAGYNYGYLHFDKKHPSGKGFDMLDLGIQISGPVAQEAISAYDDMWSGADQIIAMIFTPLMAVTGRIPVRRSKRLVITCRRFCGHIYHLKQRELHSRCTILLYIWRVMSSLREAWQPQRNRSICCT